MTIAIAGEGDLPFRPEVVRNTLGLEGTGGFAVDKSGSVFAFGGVAFLAGRDRKILVDPKVTPTLEISLVKGGVEGVPGTTLALEVVGVAGIAAAAPAGYAINGAASDLMSAVSDAESVGEGFNEFMDGAADGTAVTVLGTASASAGLELQRIFLLGEVYSLSSSIEDTLRDGCCNQVEMSLAAQSRSVTTGAEGSKA